MEKKGVKPTLFSPGLVTQGGELTESGKAAGEKWHALVGRAITNAEHQRKAAQELISKLE